MALANFGVPKYGALLRLVTGDATVPVYTPVSTRAWQDAQMAPGEAECKQPGSTRMGSRVEACLHAPPANA